MFGIVCILLLIFYILQRKKYFKHFTVKHRGWQTMNSLDVVLSVLKLEKMRMISLTWWDKTQSSLLAVSAVTWSKWTWSIFNQFMLKSFDQMEKKILMENSNISMMLRCEKTHHLVDKFLENYSKLLLLLFKNWIEISKMSRLFLLIHQHHPDDEDENLCIENRVSERAW